MSDTNDPTFKVVASYGQRAMSDIAAAAEAIEEKPQAHDYEAPIKELTARAEKAEAALVERDGPQYHGLCQFRAADGRICLTLRADGGIERGEGFPDDDKACVAFFDAMARNLKGHLHNRENRVIAAEAEATTQRGRVEHLSAEVGRLSAYVSTFDAERLQLRHQVAVAEAKAVALLEARGK